MIFSMLTRLFRYRPMLAVSAIVTWTLAFCLPIASGLVYKTLFDTLTRHAKLSVGLWVLIALLIIIALLDPLLMLLWFWTHTTFETTIEMLVRTNLFSWIMRDAGTRENPAQIPSPGELVSHIRDDVPGFTDLVNECYRLAGEGIFVVIAFIVMLRIDPLIAMSTFLPLAGVVLLVHRLRNSLASYWNAARTRTTAVTGFIDEIFSGIQLIKAGGAERRVLAHFQTLNDSRWHAELRSAVAQSSFDALSGSIGIASRGLILLFAAYAMKRGNFTVGDFVLFVTYLDWMLMFPRRVGRLLAQSKQSETALGRLGALMPKTPLDRLVEHQPVYLSGSLPQVSYPLKAEEHRLNLLEVHNLTYHYPNSTRGIQGVSFRVKPGSFTVITGQIGSGKTTVLEALLGLRSMEEGIVYWNGSEVQNPADFFIPPRSAYTPQVPRLFSETLRDNILMGLSEAQADLQKTLHLAVLEDDCATLVEGLNTSIGPQGIRLSGGQIQRTAAARMLVRTPELLVFDDLSSALDVDTEQRLWSRFDKERSRQGEHDNGALTCLVVSHRRSVLQQADQIIVMVDGKVVAVGTLPELLETCNEMKRLWESDLQPA